MWLLYTIKHKGVSNFKEVLKSRLKPGQTYKIFGKAHVDPGAEIYTGTISESEVTQPRFRHAVRLRQENDAFEVLVDNHSVRKECNLMDQNILKMVNTTSRYRLKWEDLIIYIEGSDENEFLDLMIKGAEFGFTINKKGDAVTHIVVPETPTESVGNGLIEALMRIKPAVTKTWIDDVLMKVDDRKFDMKALNAKIKPIVWKDFGPLKKSVNIGIDEKRKFLFENLEFFVFDRDQYDEIHAVIKLGKGKIRFYDIDSDENLELNHKSIFIAPPEHVKSQRKYNSLAEDYFDKTGGIREIGLEEVGFAVLYNSLNQMCNPNADMASINLPSITTTTASASMQPTLAYNPYDSVEEHEVKIEPASSSVGGAASAAPSLEHIRTTRHDHHNQEQEDTTMKDRYKDSRPTCSVAAASMDNPAEEEFNIPAEEMEVPPAQTNQITDAQYRAPAEENETHVEAVEPAMDVNDAMDDIFGSSDSPQRYEARNKSPTQTNEAPEQEEPAEEEEDADLASLMGDLTGFFADFVDTGKRKPAPKKKPTTDENAASSSTAANNAEASNNAPSPVAASSPPPTTATNTRTTPQARPSRRTDTSTTLKTRSINSNSPPAREANTIPAATSSRCVSNKRMPSSALDDSPPPTSPRGLTKDTKSARSSIAKRRKIQYDDEEEEEHSDDHQNENNDDNHQVENNDDDEEEVPNPFAIPDRPRAETSPNNQATEEGSDKFIKYAFTSLVANPRPSNVQRPAARSSNGVNFKRFRKVHQFENEDIMDIVYLVTNSQRVSTQHHNNVERASTYSQGVRIQDTGEFDPDLFIRTAIRRR